MCKKGFRGRCGVSEQIPGKGPDPVPGGLVQVLDWRFPIDPGEEEATEVLHGGGGKPLPAGAGGLEEAGPVGTGGGGERRCVGWHVESLDKQMVCEKGGIERGIAEVNHLEVDQDNLHSVHQNIFGAEVTMSERNPARNAHIYESFEAIRQVRMVFGGAPVVRVQAQVVKDGEFAKLLTPPRSGIVTKPGAMQGAGPEGCCAADLPGKQAVLPGQGARGSRFHGDHVVVEILENQLGDGACGQQGLKCAESGGFAVDPGGGTEPFLGDTKTFEGLFDHTAKARGFGEQDVIRDATAERSQPESRRIDAETACEPGERGGGSEVEQEPEYISGAEGRRTGRRGRIAWVWALRRVCRAGVP